MATTGQTINDRLNAARYALAGRGLARTVCKATTEEVLGPKKKHIDYLLACTNEPNISVPQLANLLIERTQHTSWAVVFKALATIHSLMSHGNERFAQYLATSNHSFELADFMDRTTPQGYSMSTFVRRYSKYINYKTSSYRQLAMDLCKIRTGNDNALRTMNMDNLSKTLPIVQNQFDCLLEFSAEAKDLNNGVILAAFRLLYKDLVRLYVAYQEAIINLLERYFKLSRKKTREALEMYKQYLATMDKVADFLRIVDAVGLDKSDMPDLTKSPGSILKILEQHLAQLEAKKRGTTPVSPGADEEGATKEEGGVNKENEPEAVAAEKVEPDVAKQSESEVVVVRKEPAVGVAKPAESVAAVAEKPPPPQKPARPSPKASPKVSPTSGAPPGPQAPPAPKTSSGPPASASSGAPEKKGPPERPAKPPSRPPPPAASAPAPATSQPTAAAGPPAHPPPPKTASSPTPPHPPPPQPGHHRPTTTTTTHQAHENPEQAAPAPPPPPPPAPIEATSSEQAVAGEESQAAANSNGQQATTDATNADRSATTNGQAASSEDQASSLPPPAASTCSASTADTQEVEQVRELEPIAGELGTNHVNESDGHSGAAASNELPPAPEAAAAAAAEQEEELELPPPPPPIEDAELEDIEQQHADQPDVHQENEAAVAPVENGQPDNINNNNNNINNESHADEQQ